MAFSIYTRTRSARLRVTTAEGQVILVSNLDGDQGFRMNFSCRRAMDDAPGEFDVTVYNLPPDVLGQLEAAQTRRVDDLDQLLVGAGLQSASVAEDGSDAIKTGFLVVELEAGYDEQLSRIFRAIGVRIFSRPDSSLTTTLTTITAHETIDAVVLGLPLTTFAAGTPTYEVIDYLRKIAGLGPGNFSPTTLAALLGDSRLDSPYPISGGQALDRLRALLEYLPMRWFTDDRELWICGREGVSGPNNSPPWVTDEIFEPDIILSPPQRDDGGRIIVECLLSPRLRVGRLVRLTEAGLALPLQGLSPSLQQIQRARVPPGLYRLDELEHVGDTGPGEWTSRLTLRTVVQAGGV